MEPRRVPSVPSATPVTPPTPGNEEYVFPGWNPPPHILVPPVVIPPVKPPCEDDNPDNDDECNPEEPPTDAPEPSLPVLLIVGAAVFWGSRKFRPHTDR